MSKAKDTRSDYRKAMDNAEALCVRKNMKRVDLMLDAKLSKTDKKSLKEILEFVWTDGMYWHSKRNL